MPEPGNRAMYFCFSDHREKSSFIIVLVVTSSVALQWIRSLPVRFEFHFPCTERGEERDRGGGGYWSYVRLACIRIRLVLVCISLHFTFYSMRIMARFFRVISTHVTAQASVCSHHKSAKAKQETHGNAKEDLKISEIDHGRK